MAQAARVRNEKDRADALSAELRRRVARNRKAGPMLLAGLAIIMALAFVGGFLTAYAISGK